MQKPSPLSLFFFIRRYRANSKQEAPIYLRLLIAGDTVDFSIKKHAKISNWDASKGRLKGNEMGTKELNNYLLSIEISIKENYKLLQTNSDFVTVQDIKNSYLGVAENPRKKVLDVFKTHNQNIKELIGIDKTETTYTRYETSYKRLQRFIKEKYKRKDMFLDEINHDFIRRYESFIKITYKNTHNTVIKYLKHLKKILRIANANGWMNTDPFLYIKLGEKKVDRGFLTDEELERLSKKSFTTNRLKEVRDCFVFSCFTGLSYSDIAKLTSDNIVIGSDSKRWIKINRKKTNIKSTIPILARTQELIERYKDNEYCQIKGKLLPVKSNQKMNEFLHEIAELTDIKKNLTTHLARHTFATTITLNNGVPIETVSKMLGHSSLRTTRIYARLLDKKVGEDMSKLDAIYSV